ncbi:MAG TPA: dihydrofolate reductase family protein [Acidimicrobiales bacterium]|nr:dihydrofolate reductase family protein [Acidimicrobiales bacterium]
MTKVRVHNLSMSVDGFVAGPDQDLEHPLGVGGLRLHEWAFATRTFRAMFGDGGGSSGVDDDFAAAGDVGVGATIIGRNMFGPVRGGWGDGSWRGWWGESPPYHHDVFVLTHHRRDPLEMDGGTTFHFVTSGIDDALERAVHAADGRDVRIGGGAATVRAYLQQGLIDEMHVAIVPILLGEGEPLFDRGDAVSAIYECTDLTSTPSVAHARFSRIGS